MYPLKNWHNLKRGYGFGKPTFYSDFHLGCDFMVSPGTPVYAPFDGEIKVTKDYQGSQVGNMVTFSGRGVVIRFMHNSVLYSEGKVKEGDLIAQSGNTGLSTGPHVHLDISKNKVNIYDPKNFIDPDMYFTRTFKLKVLTTDVDAMVEPVEAVQAWYKEYGIIWDMDIEEFKGAKWEGKYLDNNWLKMQIAPRASGYDVCVVVPSEWPSNGLYGYAKNEKVLGMEIVAVKNLNQKDSRNRGVSNNDQLAGTLRHELMHALYQMAGKGNHGNKQELGTQDNTHYWDYTAKDLAQCFKEFDIQKLKGWDDRLRFRYVSTNTKLKPIDFEPLEGKVYRTNDERMHFEYYKGWHLTNQASYQDKVKAGAKRGIISIEEGNYLYSLFNLTPPPRQDDILERIAFNIKDEVFYKIQGFKTFIPKNHI